MSVRRPNQTTLFEFREGIGLGADIGVSSVPRQNEREKKTHRDTQARTLWRIRHRRTSNVIIGVELKGYGVRRKKGREKTRFVARESDISCAPYRQQSQEPIALPVPPSYSVYLLPSPPERERSTISSQCSNSIGALSRPVHPH